MKKIFIYYSLTGNGDAVANVLNKKIDIRKIKVKKTLPKSFFLRMLVGGFKSLVNFKEKLVNFDNNIDDYNEIIIGSPIWNDRLSTPVMTALSKMELKDKKIIFILYSGGGSGNKASQYIKSNYRGADIIILREPRKNSDELSKIKKIFN